jgi:adenine phosphoribosyltransferase
LDLPLRFYVEESGVRFPEGVDDPVTFIKTVKRVLRAKILRRKYVIFAFGVEFEIEGEKTPMMVDQDGWAFIAFEDNSIGVRELLVRRLRASKEFAGAEAPGRVHKMNFDSVIRSIPDYPKPGIVFRDITTLLGNPRAFRRAVDEMVQPYAGVRVDKVAGIEARGFILGGAVAHQLSVGFVPVRKKGKLPWKVIGVDYQLEYGNDRVEIHEDAVKQGEHVILVDDLIATGGTAFAAIKLLEQGGAKVVGCSFVIDLPELGGADKIRALGKDVTTLVTFEGH